MTSQMDRPTVVLSRRVKPGCEAAFQAWVEGFTAAVATFEGYVAHQSVPPVADAQPDWVFVFTFDTPGHLRAWIDSDIRRNWLAQAEGCVLHEGPAQVISGLEILFGLKPPSVAQPPAVWKLALLTLAALWPTAAFNAWLIGPWIQPWPLLARTLVTSAVVVAQMTWIVMPVATRLGRRWLQPDR